MTLAEKMVKYRAMNNLSQGQLAKLCNVTLQTICNIEGGKQTPSALTEAKIRLVVEKIEIEGD